MAAKEEISDGTASCAENDIPHPWKQCGLYKKLYYSDLMVDKLLSYSFPPLIPLLSMAPKWGMLKLTVLACLFGIPEKVNLLLEVESMAGFRVLLIFHMPNLCQPKHWKPIRTESQGMFSAQWTNPAPQFLGEQLTNNSEGLTGP